MSVCVRCGKTSVLKCSRCHQATYCSKECHKIKWPEHKPYCIPVANEQERQTIKWIKKRRPALNQAILQHRYEQPNKDDILQICLISDISTSPMTYRVLAIKTVALANIPEKIKQMENGLETQGLMINLLFLPFGEQLVPISEYPTGPVRVERAWRETITNVIQS